jgi:tetratricopeptide (TPR) repeat protein
MGTGSGVEHEEGMASGRLGRYKLYLRQRPTMLILLSILVVVLFLAVTGLSKAYHAQRESLGTRWFTRGVADLNAQRYEAAVMDFRSALLYSRDEYSYQLNLAEALIGLKHTGEASAYLLNLWDREPENGLVNLELARIAAQRGDTDQAVRYYHGAVYAAWPQGEEVKRRNARLELIDLLLQNKDVSDAQAELIALAANVGGEPAQQEAIGNLFVRAGDYQHALAAYHIAMRADGHNAAVMAGAGYAAFQLGQYPLAERYLREAVAESSGGATQDSAHWLQITQMVLRMDPFQRGISTAERNKIVVEGFTSAGERLKNCAPPLTTTPGSGPPVSLSNEWAAMKPQITPAGLRRDPDLSEKAMDLVFRIERQTSIVCGTPTGNDLALFLIAKVHEGS